MKDYAKKYYHVIFCDEYDNWYFIGKFTNLRDAEPELNEMLKDSELAEDVSQDEPAMSGTPEFGEGKNLGVLCERAGTMGPAFDVEIGTTCGCCRVGGYISEEIDIPALLEDVAKELLDEGYKCDARACASNNEVVKAMESHQAYQKFGMADAYKNAAKLIAHPELLDPQTLLKIMAEAEKENKEND